MALCYGNLFGFFRGRLGNVIGYVVDGKQYVRTAPVRRKKALTEAQTRHHEKFRMASRLLKALKPVMKITYHTRTKRKSYYSTAMKQVFREVITETEMGLALDYAKLRFTARQELLGPAEASVSTDGSGIWNFQWRYYAGYEPDPGDQQVMLIAYHEGSERCAYQMISEKTEEGKALWNCEEFIGKKVHSWMIFLSQKMGKVSGGYYMGMITDHG